MTSRFDPWPAPEGKRARTRRLVLLAAGEVFSRRSVEQATIDEIAEAAGVSDATVYVHFGTKDALALAYLDAVFDLLEADLRRLRAEPSPFKRVLAAGDAYLQHVIDYPAASRMASVRAAYPPAEHIDEAAQKLDRRMVTTLMGVAADLKEAMDRGEISEAPVDETMLFVWNAWHGVATSVVRGDHLAIPPVIAKRVLIRGRKILLAALSVTPPPTEPRPPTPPDRRPPV